MSADVFNSGPPSADRLFDNHIWQFSCIRKIEFVWDQWMVCRIACNHGTYTGASRGIYEALGESLADAFEKFRSDNVTHDRED